MKKIDLSQTITILANLGVLAGIAFLAYERRQNRIATQLMASESHLVAVAGQADLIAANPQLAELLARAIAGEEISPGERLQLSNLFASALRAWQNSYFQYTSGAMREDMLRAYDQTMMDWMLDLPLIRDYWEGRTDRFSPEFVEYVQSVLSTEGSE